MAKLTPQMIREAIKASPETSDEVLMTFEPQVAEMLAALESIEKGNSRVGEPVSDRPRAQPPPPASPEELRKMVDHAKNRLQESAGEKANDIQEDLAQQMKTARIRSPK